MADDKSDKGFTVVDRRINADEEDASSDDRSALAEEPQTVKEEQDAVKEEQAPPGPAVATEDAAADVSKEERKAAKEEADKVKEDHPPGFEINFPSFLLSLHTSALINLGLVPHPMSNEKVADLPLSRQNIDLLEIIKEKTKGNLTAEESKLLDNILYELRMAYVEVAG